MAILAHYLPTWHENLNVWEPEKNEWHVNTACMPTLSGLTFNAPLERLPDCWYDPDSIRGAISRADVGREPSYPGPRYTSR